MRAKLACGVFILSLGILTSFTFAGEDDIRQTFAQLQKALKARDGDKIWALIDSDSQSDADRAAKAVQNAFAKAGANDKADYEKKYGLTDKELAAMTGKLFLKSSRFHGKYHEVPGSKIESVKVKADTARLNYIEDDGDKEKLAANRAAKGQWKFILPMPKAVD